MAFETVRMSRSFCVSAISPFNLLLGGKLVACLIKSKNIAEDLSAKYGRTTGLISGKKTRKPFNCNNLVGARTLFRLEQAAPVWRVVFPVNW
jgi:hypothetical protein